MWEQIRVRKGFKRDLPILDVGEFGYCTDTNELFIGSTNEENKLISTVNFDGTSLKNSPENGIIKINGNSIIIYDDTDLRELLDKKVYYNQLSELVTISDLNKMLTSKADTKELDTLISIEEFTNTLESKANKIHQHGLEEIKDIDATNKINGYALQYDTEVGKFLSKPLPNSMDITKMSLAELSDVDESIKTTSEGSILKFKDGFLNASVDTTNSNNQSYYVIELNRWGITQGSFGKPPYSKNQWTIAYNNSLGFNKALKHANDNGLSRVMVPNGIYSFCYTNLGGASEIYAMVNTPINLFSNQTLDLNGSTFEVIYDSVNKNPYDKSPLQNPAWKLSGEIINISDVTNVHISNGTIIGDIPNRSFSDGGSGFNSERGMEATYGIKVKSGSSNITIENIDVSMFMGDGITIDSYPTKTGKWILNPSNTKSYPGYVDSKGVIVQTVPGTYLSNKFAVIPGEHKQLQMRTSGGYTRIPTIANRTFEYLFYNSSDILLERKKAVYLQILTVPRETSYIRIQFTNEATDLANIDIQYAITKPQSSYVKIYGCLIHDNHRGGISGGADFTHIAYNKIYHNGMDSGLNVPFFPDSTRYAINFEDSFSNYVIVENNHIFSGFNGLLMGVYHGRIIGNIFTQIGGVVVYNNANMIIDGNVFYESNALLISNSVPTQIRDILFTNNTVNTTSIIVVTTGTKTSVRLVNNIINTDTVNIAGNVEVIGNRIKSYSSSNHTGYTNITINNVKSCTGNTFEDFNHGSHYRVSVMKSKDSTSFVSDNVFRSVSFTSHNLANDIEFYNSEFYNCSVYSQVLDSNLSHSMTFYNCYLQDTSVVIGGPYGNNRKTGDITGKIAFRNSKINFTPSYTNVYFMGISDNIPITGYEGNATPRNYELEISNCEFLYRSKIVLTLIKYYNIDTNFDVNNYKKVRIEDSKIILSDISNLRLFLNTNSNIFTNSAIIKNTTYEGFKGFTSPIYGSLEVYNPIYVSSSSTVPIYGSFIVGQRVENTNIIAGGFLGWICVKSGIANATPWKANKTYITNTLINTGGKVYKVKSSGTTGNRAPTNSIENAVDGTIEWEYVGDLAEFKTYGLISK